VSVKFIKDLAERTILTFLEAWLGAWVVLAEHDLDDLFDGKLLGAAGVAAVAAAVKALGARQVGDPESASLAPEV
jgi:hypothetical protein